METTKLTQELKAGDVLCCMPQEGTPTTTHLQSRYIVERAYHNTPTSQGRIGRKCFKVLENRSARVYVYLTMASYAIVRVRKDIRVAVEGTDV